ncbi:lipopolysaccharide biosynthesis protein RfbH [Yersinia mollaretii]|uniref:DegT/DnrJ/EryC1/StrS family aminotransferase n=1 Tax=Yersinia mollaretii TaxID=33060 RepID=UPI0005DF613F|nr:DegT/DnrJ/EryC1/StrS family aminotransferase [Yersinia mollaretii]CQJ32824.1 lipopolysaccharide biosynthesis protein RfbH [Yersinia mollaretii]
MSEHEKSQHTLKEDRVVTFAGVYAGEEEAQAVERVLKSEWLTAGVEADAFEREFSDYIGTRFGLVVNSGSSANLLALAALNLPRGARIITCACGFPATVNPIIHLGFEPVFVDIDIATGNICLEQVERYAPTAQAIIIAHTLGLPVNMERIIHIATRYNLKVIEDCCEAAGSRYKGKYVGTFGDISTFSFYPSHQMTALGGGGMVLTDSDAIAMRVKSMREWGKRQIDPHFEGDYSTELSESVDNIPYGRNYIYDTIGYNFKYPEANCAYGREQLKRLTDLNEKRRVNYEYVRSKLIAVNHKTFELTPDAEPAYFGYGVYFNEPRKRDHVISYLECKGIRVRPFFAGNILRQPAYRHLADCSNFPNADFLMQNALFFGVWAGLSRDDMNYVVEVFKKAVEL